VSSSTYERIRDNPKFQQLVRRRTRFACLLSAAVLLSWYGFIMVVAFGPDLLRLPIAPGAVLTTGVPVGAGIVLLGWLLTGWYVYRANTEFDLLNQQILMEAGQ
jgi:uncharacterized membrane protein (DUF485 family)